MRAVGQHSLRLRAELDEFQYGRYDQLQPQLVGTGLQAHHIYEKRFWRQLGYGSEEVATASIMCVAVTYAEHVYLTQAIRQMIGYSGSFAPVTTTTATAAEILEAHQMVYQTVGVAEAWLPQVATTVPILK
jgi:hypothetical protein